MTTATAPDVEVELAIPHQRDGVSTRRFQAGVHHDTPLADLLRVEHYCADCSLCLCPACQAAARPDNNDDTRST